MSPFNASQAAFVKAMLKKLDDGRDMAVGSAEPTYRCAAALGSLLNPLGLLGSEGDKIITPGKGILGSPHWPAWRL